MNNTQINRSRKQYDFDDGGMVELYEILANV